MIYIFFRKHPSKDEEMFYPIQAMDGIDVDKDVEEHARLNPGTLRIEDINGKVLWPKKLH